MTYIGPKGAWDAIVAAGTDWDVVTMVAISGAESGYDTEAVSPTHDFGLLQINHDAWGELFGQFDWRDPYANAEMGHHVWQQQGLTAWVTYNTGDYRAHLAEAQGAAGGGGLTGGAGFVGGGNVQQNDWAGWDFSSRVSMSGRNFLQAFTQLSYQGTYAQWLYDNWTFNG